jgi:hypothetical protein
LNDNRVSGGSLLESATNTCSHCHRQVILNPNRSRERTYCQGCNHYICDSCAVVKKVTMQCTPMRAELERMAEAMVLGEQAPRGTVLISL